MMMLFSIVCRLSLVTDSDHVLTTHYSCSDQWSVSDRRAVSDRWSFTDRRSVIDQVVSQWSVSHERSVAAVIKALSSEVLVVSAGGIDGDRQRSLRLSLSDLHTHIIIYIHHTQRNSAGLAVLLAIYNRQLAHWTVTTLCLKTNIPNVFSYNSRKHWRIFIIFGRNVTEKASNHMLLYFSTSPN